jgi:SAM-dependent methyltransferase
MFASEGVEAGQAVYSPMVLRTYDWIVLGISNRFLWRCPTAELRRLYDRNVSGRHLDVGVGTGYFLDKAKWPVAKPAITLLDLNPNCLAAASRRISRFSPQSVQANALAPLPFLGPFQSAGLCYLLHCLPGAIAEKGVVFDNLAPVLERGARVFGATIMQGNAPRSMPAQALMNLYNNKGIFSNVADTVEDLHAALCRRFRDVEVNLRGTVALFEARAA